MVTYTGNGGSSNRVKFTHKPRRLWFADGTVTNNSIAITGNDTKISTEVNNSRAGPIASTLFSSNVVDIGALSNITTSNLNVLNHNYTVFCLETT